MNLLQEFSPVRQNLLRILATSLFVLLVLTLPRYTEIAKTWYLLLILCGFFYLLFNLNDLRNTTNAERALFAVLLLNFAWIAFCYYANGEPGRGASFLWGRHFYLPFLIPLFFLFRKIHIPHRILLLTLCASVSISLVDILIDLLQGIDHRLQGMNPNAFGPIQLCLSGILLLYAFDNPDRPLRWLAAAGFVMGLATVIFSKSKNTWLTLFVLCVLTVIYLTRFQPLWKRTAVTGLIVLLLCASYLLPIVQTRIDSGLASVTNYFSSDDYRDDSRLGTFGTRMELWKAGWEMFLENPLIGVGVGGFQEMSRRNSERYQVNDVVHQFKYAHNQYIVALATRGIPGLILLLAVLMLPLYIAMSHKARDGETRVAKWSIVLIGITYFVGSIFEDHFEGKSAIMFVGTFVPLWLANISPGDLAKVIADG